MGRADERPLEYALSPDNAVFVQGTYRHTDYDMKTTTANRTSDEWRAGVGAIADVSSLIRIAGAVGYFRRTYDNPAFDSIGDLDVDFRLDYYVSPLTTVSTVFTRQLEEAIVAGSWATWRPMWARGSITNCCAI